MTVIDPRPARSSVPGAGKAPVRASSTLGPNGNRVNIAVGPDGTVFVDDEGNHRVQAFTPDGTFIRQMGSFGTDDGQFSRPHYIAVDSQGSLYAWTRPAAH